MEKESPNKEGLVGIFDILGYQYIIDNNEINYVADLISNTLLNLPQKGADKLISRFKDDEIADIYSSAISRGALKWRIFSDTILLSYPFTHKELPKAVSIVDYLFFLITYHIFCVPLLIPVCPYGEELIMGIFTSKKIALRANHLSTLTDCPRKFKYRDAQ